MVLAALKPITGLTLYESLDHHSGLKRQQNRSSLPDCLRSAVLPATVQREIILVEDGSTDNTAELDQAFVIRLLRDMAARGAAAARYTGIAAAQGEVILFTDADCVPRQNWVAEMLRPFTNPTVMGGKGIYATNQPQLTARFVQIESEDKYDLLRQQPAIDFIDTYSAAYRAAVLRACSGFDERIRYVEDQDLSFRLAELGHVMVFQPTAVVLHQHSDSLGRYVRKKFMIGYFFYPVVPKDTARIRVQLSSAHTEAHIDRALAAFGKVGRALGVV